MAAQASPPHGRGRRGVRGAKSPRRPQRVEAAPPPHRWRPALAVAGIPRWRDSGCCGPCRSGHHRSHETEDLRRGELVMWTGRRSSSRRLASAGSGKVVKVVFELGGPVHRSFRRRGQFLVVVGALVGALIGTTLGLIAEDAQPSTAVAAAGLGRGAALAASPPSSHPPASRTAGAGHGNDSSGTQRAESPGRPDKRDGNAHKDRAGGKDKPGKGKDKPGKGK